jgi:RNA polymerase sigma-70 factor (ECF subfamily)
MAWRAWVFTTARRRALDERRRRTRDQIDWAPDLTGIAAETMQDTANLAVEQMDTDRTLALIAQLPPLQAEVIVLRVVVGLPADAVGRMLGRSPGAVRVAAHRGLKSLAALLTAAGVTP